MPYWRLFYHMVWSTKGRAPFIEDAITADLYRVLTGRAQALGAWVYAVGGTQDHVHLVASVPPAIALADFIGQIKGSSTHAVTHEIRPNSDFAWQSEYGVVSFGGRQLDWVVKYVLEQRQHHERGTIVSFLERLAPPVASPPNSEA